ncbi:hypothetical protein [Streptomyces lacrimifluminis]|uniref:hypothetical protein n=1 Tax=Streptomyces lacrimifluminis TaxID=1500077 RepID=UPI00166ECC46|nr:hypothetical protein [Streptomyces lacrimifluminis]
MTYSVDVELAVLGSAGLGASPLGLSDAMGEGSCGPLATGSVPGSVDGDGSGEVLPPSDGDGDGETDTDGDGPASETLGLGPGSRRVVLGAGLELADALGFGAALTDGAGDAPAFRDGVALVLTGASGAGDTPAAASDGGAESVGSGLVST